MFMRCLALFPALLLALAAQGATLVPHARLIDTPTGNQAIVLQRLSVSAELSGGMAQTTVKMVFYNPNRRQLEGTLQFPLRDGQQVTAFALDIDGAMRPAVPVEKERGRAVFESIERQRVDPALLEVTQGNNFKLRIYPIGPMATRTVELTYAEPLARRGSQWAYRLPLEYGAVQDFDLALKVNGGTAAPKAAGIVPSLHFERVNDTYAAHFARQQFTPEGMLEILVDAHLAPQVYLQERNGATYFIAEVPVVSKRVARPRPRTIGLLWDSSGSGARRALTAELAELERYFKALGTVDVRLVRLRDRTEAPLTFKLRGGDWSALRRELEATVYDGASALNDWQPQGDVDQYLLVSDGLANYGGTRFPVLAANQRLFALDSALSADSARLAALAERAGGALVAVDPHMPGAAAQALLFQDARIEQLSATGATELETESRTAKDGLLRIAGRLLAPDGQLTLTLANGGRSETMRIALPANAPFHPLAASTWASFRLHALEADYDLRRAEIGRIGRQFGVPTRETSLIVLDRLEDYVRYDIEPPAQYMAAYAKLKQMRFGERERVRGKHFDDVVRLFERRVAWWNASYPLSAPKNEAPVQPVPMPAPPRLMEMQSKSAPGVPELLFAPSQPAPAMARRVEVTGSALRYAEAGGGSANTSAPQAAITLQKWTANAPYIDRLRGAAADTVYAVYLDEKPNYANSSAFFLDAADILFDKGQRELALRVLSNLAEMDLENRASLRILGYRLLQADAPQLALPVFEKVLQLAKEEPQSFRDLGLAHAAAGHYQQAIDSLYEVVLRPWDSRFPEIETIAIAEINAIAARAGTALDMAGVDPRLRKNLPLDLRVILTWDADNADMDLWVTDPNGETCNYAHALTAQGGRMSRDFTGGYGPEEFSLHRAKPGKYKIEANYFGNRQQVLAGATTLQVKLYTGFGTMQQKEQVVTLRLKERGETVYVGEFEVATSGSP